MPPKKAPPKRRPLRVLAAVLEKDGKWLIAKRKKGDRFGGLWEFPGGKLEPGETPEGCLARELAEELEVEVQVGRWLGGVLYSSADFVIELVAYSVSSRAGSFRLHDHEEIRWVSPSEIRGFALTEPDRLLLEKLLAGDASGGDVRTSLSSEKNRDKPIRQRHRGSFPAPSRAGPTLRTVTSSGREQGRRIRPRLFQPQGAIVGRMLTFDATPPLEAIERSLAAAIALRRRLVEPESNAQRLVNGEGDGLPGLIVDRYGDVVVIQVATLGMEKLKPAILDRLVKALAPRSIYERSDLPARREEGLPEFEGHLYGERVESIEIREGGLRFLVEFGRSQKTGFYLDLREMRKLVRSLAAGGVMLLRLHEGIAVPPGRRSHRLGRIFAPAVSLLREPGAQRFLLGENRLLWPTSLTTCVETAYDLIILDH
jgi:mutator protein MutT